MPPRRTFKLVFKKERKRQLWCSHSCLCGSWPVLWHSGVWCVELSGGNVGGERVQSEKEGGRKGSVCCGDFWKEFFHPRVTYLHRWLTEGRVVWVCQKDYLSGTSSPRKNVFWEGCPGNRNHRLQGRCRHACQGFDWVRLRFMTPDGHSYLYWHSLVWFLFLPVGWILGWRNKKKKKARIRLSDQTQSSNLPKCFRWTVFVNIFLFFFLYGIRFIEIIQTLLYFCNNVQTKQRLGGQ